ncbi:hypothetical protein dsat_2232 [Alkalidesulfovibrio alkalitolerans DSM 16529]|uniref:Dicarboxylate transport n=1 Tax=Alkalidesulfovibrio alkalitolerans DSM 16529 TaxID=1121439 RepID=S7ULU8_9BACT|nr:hypothetical protein [Alkalidesulfovibrio alkalitolerans]EPR34869.1 hypothetical protein dsat_2232 [Alkalidesulfovibrio alkalitolerans DSM 16529]
MRDDPTHAAPEKAAPLSGDDAGHGPQKPASPRKRLVRRMALWSAALLLLLVAALVLALALVTRNPDLVVPIAQNAARTAGMELSIGHLDLSISPLRLEVRELYFDNDPSAVDGETLRVHLRLERLAVTAAPGEWPHGPWFAEVELWQPRAEIALAREPDETPGEPFTWQEVLSALGRLRIIDGGARLAFANGVFAVADLDLALEPGGPDGERPFSLTARPTFTDETRETAVSGLLSAGGVVWPDLDVDATLSLLDAELRTATASGNFETAISLRRQGETLDIPSLSLTANGLRVVLPDGAARDLPAVSATAAATLNLADGAFHVPGLTLAAEGLASLKGRGEGGPDGFSAAEGSGRIDDLAAAFALLGGLVPADLRDMEPRGALDTAMTLDGARLALGLAPDRLSLDWPRFGLRLDVSGSPVLRGSPGEEWELDGDLRLRGDADFGGVALRGLDALARLGGTLDAPAVPDLRLALPAKGVIMDGEALPLGAAEIKAALAREADGTLFAREVVLREERLGRFTGEAAVRPEEPGQTRARLASGEIQLAALAALALDLGLVEEALPPLSGHARLDVRVQPGAHGARAACAVRVDKAGFATPDGQWLADGLSGALDLALPLAGPDSAEARLRLGRGEVLYGTIYLDLAQTPFSLSMNGDLHGFDDVREARGEMALGGLARVGFSHGIARRAAQGGLDWGLGLRLLQADLPELLKTFVTDPNSVSNPDLAQLHVMGAPTLSLYIQGHADDGTAITGRLGLEDGFLDYEPARLAVRGLTLDMPLNYVFGAPAPDAADDVARGRLSIDSLAIPSGETRSVSAAIDLAPNILRIDGTLRAPLLGGALSLSRIRVREPLSADFQASLAAVLEDGDLAFLGTEQAPLEGRIEAAFESVTLTRERLDADGSVAGALYGGAFSVDGIFADNPLARNRVAGCSAARLRGLDMERLSLALGIGRVTGRLDIDVEDFLVSFGQPQGFDMRIRSVPTDGVPQLVSLNAVNSISVVGTGEGISGVGLFASFFREFGYEALGVHLILKNDVFSVRGLIREAGVEYLIKRPPMFGINVVNSNPDNRISFSDMVERVRRVLQSAPTEQGVRKDDPKTREEV